VDVTHQATRRMLDGCVGNLQYRFRVHRWSDASDALAWHGMASYRDTSGASVGRMAGLIVKVLAMRFAARKALI
jgi:hypothetical protein